MDALLATRQSNHEPVSELSAEKRAIWKKSDIEENACDEKAAYLSPTPIIADT